MNRVKVEMLSSVWITSLELCYSFFFPFATLPAVCHYPVLSVITSFSKKNLLELEEGFTTWNSNTVRVKIEGEIEHFYHECAENQTLFSCCWATLNIWFTREKYKIFLNGFGKYMVEKQCLLFCYFTFTALGNNLLETSYHYTKVINLTILPKVSLCPNKHQN